MPSAIRIGVNTNFSTTLVPLSLKGPQYNFFNKNPNTSVATKTPMLLLLQDSSAPCYCTTRILMLSLKVFAITVEGGPRK
jgi:hypothetical protein